MDEKCPQVLFTKGQEALDHALVLKNQHIGGFKCSANGRIILQRGNRNDGRCGTQFITFGVKIDAANCGKIFSLKTPDLHPERSSSV